MRNALAKIGDVFVVAPERPRSAVGHAITLHKPLRLSKSRMADGSEAWSTNGTPADCVTLGAIEVMNDDVDVVVSGINHGPNLGWDVHYSGTVSAAFEGVMIGYPAIAVSVTSWDPVIDWRGAADYAARLAVWLYSHPLPPHTLLNVNAPNIAPEALTGIAVTTLGSRQYVDRIVKRTDPVGRDYFWLGGTLLSDDAEQGTDVRAIADGKISVSPLCLDLTSAAVARDIGAVTSL